ncbi:hypothetical protein CL648_03890 [bacterium]|jgi:cell division protein FtsB|nr:hypothetical protein [bacterium]|tara:strand:+ start:4549 stop:4860 length:312 start_codon:yes stop_codon:yes gene_type:complete
MARVAIGILGACLAGYLIIETIHNLYRYTAYRIEVKKNQEKMINMESELAVITEELGSMDDPDFIDTLIRKRLNYVSKQDVVYQIRRPQSQTPIIHVSPTPNP